MEWRYEWKLILPVSKGSFYWLIWKIKNHGDSLGKIKNAYKLFLKITEVERWFINKKTLIWKLKIE